ncbi:HAMP domain-containing sensor histidine kinase [Limnohabitans sp.]|uniref:sensor histidine kinase n=2 Tax=Limnohabitans sp. TaxID=1907725 RepID=UPI0031FE126A
MGWLFWECYQYARVWPSWSSKGMAVLLAIQLFCNFVRTGAVIEGYAQWALFLHWTLAFMGLMMFFLFFDVLQLRKAEQEQHLVNSLAHELRQPLGAMRLKLEHLIHDAPSMPDHEASDLLHQLVSENDRASAIIQGLRRFFDMSQVQRQPMNLSEMLEGMVARIRPDLSSRGMALEADVQPGIRVLADASQLDMVVYNLLLNAREALQEMEDQVGRSIRLHLCAVGDVAQLQVIDNGPGVSRDNAHRIFEIHFTSKAKGTGLGLWLCRAVVQEHGGQLALLPSDRGAAFEVRLPLLAESYEGLNRLRLDASLLITERKKGAQIG